MILSAPSPQFTDRAAPLTAAAAARRDAPCPRRAWLGCKPLPSCPSCSVRTPGPPVGPAAADPAAAARGCSTRARPPAGRPACAGPARSPPGLPANPDKGSVTGLPLPRFVSLRTDEVNLRTGPGMQYPIEWLYKRRGLPVEVEREFDVWRLVVDPDGVKGWRARGDHHRHPHLRRHRRRAHDARRPATRRRRRSRSCSRA